MPSKTNKNTDQVDIIASEQAPSGIGEFAVPMIAPAVTNALFSLTGKRIRQLPICSHMPA
jgi:isoquinoline 1-oxidoreductase subunit beta